MSFKDRRSNCWKFLIFGERMLLKNIMNLDKIKYDKLHRQMKLYDKKMKKIDKTPERLLEFDYRKEF